MEWFWPSLTPQSRSGHQSCSIKKSVLKNFTKFTGKHLYQSLFFNKVANLRPATLLKERLCHGCFPVNVVNVLRAPFLQSTSGRLLLTIKSLVHSEWIFLWLYVIMSRTSFRVNPHSIVCLNVKELLAQSRRHIWSLSDSNEIRTHNHLARKRTFNRISLLSLEYFFVDIFLCLWFYVNSFHVTGLFLYALKTEN